jgi:hypothetical protein
LPSTSLISPTSIHTGLVEFRNCDGLQLSNMSDNDLEKNIFRQYSEVYS